MAASVKISLLHMALVIKFDLPSNMTIAQEVDRWKLCRDMFCKCCVGYLCETVVSAMDPKPTASSAAS